VIRLLFAALVLSALLAQPAVARERIDAEDLKIRSEAGDKRATRALAESYYLGRGGVEQDFREAARWYRRLASQGDARAQTSLGLMYANGLGFEKNLVEARRWWSLAAAQNDAGAQHNLGMVFLAGQGVAPDPAHALHWFQRAAKRGHVQSQRILGLMFYDGEGTTPDRLQGLTWLTIAAENGEEGAQQALKMLAKRVDAEQLEHARVQAQQWLKENAATR
jgi:TPR repeat protein